ncbi:tyrosine-type recombinase/integrase [Laribacter hongkongensis]|uniref:tyrosine-type recombinase/integrase n=1 Tax=Laribacter hongkongensis TaxID=168471 RepID=UPI001EFD6D90|nr:site-specific integrase [Laribacter hongkongensis]MCG9056638.1 tyrosine-type recombinase/integrase [Laribacter hongkongensis]
MPTLTTRRIESEKANPTKDRRIADGLGLYLKIAKNGTKTFTYRFTYAARRQEMTLGTYPETSLAGAREKHLEARKALEAGRNPLQTQQAQRQALKLAPTVEELVEEYHSRVLSKTFKRPEEALRTLTRDVQSQIGKFLAKDVTGREIALLINKIVDRGAPVAANRALLLTKKLFAYAVEQHYIESNPVAMTRKGAGGKEQSRDRALSFEELRTLLKALQTYEGKTSWQSRLALHMLVLTGQRPGEVASMEWAHIDVSTGIWNLPAEYTKAERAHVVHLSDQAIALLAEIQPLTGTGQHVFQSPKNKHQSIDRHSLSRAVKRLHADNALSGIKEFTPHDLRRTVATRMADIGIAPYIIEKILNHQMEGVMAVYNRAQYLAEREEALNIWGKKMAELIATDGQNVIHFRKRAA